MRNVGACAAFVVLVAIGSLPSRTFGAAGGEEVYRRLAPSVWSVRTYDADGLALAQGSAVVVGPGALVTNCHVLARASRVSVKQATKAFDATLQHVDVDRDLCQLRAAGVDAPAVTVGDSERLTVGQRIYTLGNPVGMAQTFSDGLVSALRRDADKQLVLIQISAPISHGSSGGGLFDEQGRLVGITSAVVEDAQNLNFAIPIHWLRELPARSAAALARHRARTTARAQPTKPPEPKRAAYASLDDMTKLPLRSERGRAAYQEFLKTPYPRAFAISAAGHWWSSWGRVSDDPFADDAGARAVRNCEKLAQERCVLYAEDGVVVYRGEFASTQR